MNELELKLLLDRDAETRLRTRARSDALHIPPGSAKSRTARLLTRYFDTPDGALGRAGMALRLRREGRRWTQTVKVKTAHVAGLSAASEAECPAPGGRLDLSRIPDPDLREAVGRRINGSPLEAVFETDMQRTIHLFSPDGLSTVELAIDTGEIRAGEQVAELREAEFELKEGEPAALFDAARILLPDGGIVFSHRSKAERGALLAAEGRIVDPTVPRRARTVQLDRGQTAESAAASVLAECLEQVAANIEVIRRSDDTEGPHQLRIGLRRLRTALRLFRDPLDGLTLRRLDAEARWFAREVGHLRDIDVASVDLIEPEMARAGDDPGFASLGAAVAAEADNRRAALRATLAEPRVQAFLLDLAEFVALRGWLDSSDMSQTARLAEPVEMLAARMLDHARARACKRAKGVEKLDIEARHDLRKALKALRYAIEFFLPLWPRKRVRRMLKPLRALQDHFGNLNDLAMAEELFLGPDAPGASDPAAARAAGRIIGARGADAAREWPLVVRGWKAFRDKVPFWA